MKKRQEKTRTEAAGIPIKEPEVSSSEVSSLTRPLLSNSDPVVGSQSAPFNFVSTPTRRFTGHATQTSRISVRSRYHDRVETSVPPNRNRERAMVNLSFHQSRFSPRFPSIHQSRPSIRMSSIDSVRLSPQTSIFNGLFQHTMGIPYLYPYLPTVFIHNPYHFYLQPPIRIPSLVQVTHPSGASCTYESAHLRDGISSGHQEDSPRSNGTRTNRTTLHESPAGFRESAIALRPLQNDHYQHPTVGTTLVTRAPSQSFKPSRHSNELNAPKASSDRNIHGMGITQLKNSMNHRPFNSEKTKTFECHRCQKKFRYRSDLTRHLAVHTNEKLFECNRCDRKFRYPCTLKLHYKSVHHDDGDHIFECEKCGQKFGYERTLKRHYDSVHLDEKKFVCIRCGQKFKREDNLKRHYKGVHQLLECETCGQKFDCKGDLKRHNNIVHRGMKNLNVSDVAKNVHVSII